MVKYRAMLIAAVILSMPISAFIPNRLTDEDAVTDIDGNVYKIVKIGNREWMAENLKVSRYSNGKRIAEVVSDDDWEKLVAGGWCYYNNDVALGEKQGKLYNWFAVDDKRGLCPTGWHVPSNEEWQSLVDYLGGEKIAGNKLKETASWSCENEKVTGSSGFAALPSGYRLYTGKSNFMGRYCGFWTSTEGNREFSWLRYLDCNDSGAARLFYGKKNGLSCRCVKN